MKLFDSCVRICPDRVKRARAQIMNEQAIVGINIGKGDSGVPDHGPNTPVERVILPDDRLQAQLIRNITNAVLW